MNAPQPTQPSKTWPAALATARRMVPCLAVVAAFVTVPLIGPHTVTPPAPVPAAAEAHAQQLLAQAAQVAWNYAADLPQPTSRSIARLPLGQLLEAVADIEQLAQTVKRAPTKAPAAKKAKENKGFIHPVEGRYVSGFGPRVHPALGRAMYHTGIDLMAACGTPIRAAADGKVSFAKQSESWGNRVILTHTPDLKTAYGHMTKFAVKEGQKVKQGQVIGTVGTTGWSTGCHLHWDVIVKDEYVDPAPHYGLPATHNPPIGFNAPKDITTGGGQNRAPAAPDGDLELPGPAPRPPAAVVKVTKPAAGKPATPAPTRPAPSGTPRPSSSAPAPTAPRSTPSTPITTPPAQPTPAPTRPTSKPSPTSPAPTQPTPTTPAPAQTTPAPTASTVSEPAPAVTRTQELAATAQPDPSSTAPAG